MDSIQCLESVFFSRIYVYEEIFCKPMIWELDIPFIIILVHHLKKLVRLVIESCIFSIQILNLPRDYLNQFSPIKLLPSEREMEKKKSRWSVKWPNQCLSGKRSEIPWASHFLLPSPRTSASVISEFIPWGMDENYISINSDIIIKIKQEVTYTQ